MNFGILGVGKHKCSRSAFIFNQNSMLYSGNLKSGGLLKSLHAGLERWLRAYEVGEINDKFALTCRGMVQTGGCSFFIMSMNIQILFVP